jgi:hypothetical protein
LESVLVESESELCNRGNNTSYIYLAVRLTPGNNLYTPTLSGKSVCGDLLTCIPLFLESVFEVPLKKNRKKEEEKRKKEKKRKGLIPCVCFFLLFRVVLCDFLCVQTRISSTV